MNIRDRIVELRRVPARDLIPSERNWRTHPPAQRAALSGVLAEIGIANAVLARQTDDGLVLIDGHLRQDVLDGQDVPVLVLDVDAHEADLLLATLDPIGAMAAADAAQLDALLRDVSTGEAAIQEMLAELAEQSGLTYGAQPAVAEDPGAQVDRADELRQKWGTERGQLWEIGRHRLLCGDSTSAADISALMGAARADIVFTDPPYGVDFAASNKARILGDQSQVAIPLSFKVAIERATTDDARLYFCGASSNFGMYAALFDAYCAQHPILLIWVKESFIMRPNNYHSQFEAIYFGWKGKGGSPQFWYGDRKCSDVWQVHRDPADEREHPTQKPVELPARAIRYSCPPGGIVLEPFVGSASTVVAAEQEGRRCFACEIDPGYVAVALERLSGMGLEPRCLETE